MTSHGSAMSITIRDIAADAGVSSATVSKYLNGRKISSRSAEKIRTSIEQLQYVPNRSAQLLRKKINNSIAVILTNLNDYFWSGANNAIEDFMLDHNFSTMLQYFDPAKKDQTDFFNFLMSTGTAGCIMIDEQIGQTNFLDLLNQHEIPFVFMDSRPSDYKVDLVTTSNYQAAYRAGEYLISKGHRSFGVLSAVKDHYTAAERLHGFEDVCRAYDIPKSSIHIAYGDYHINAGYPMIRSLLNDFPLPDAIISMNFYYLLAAVQELSIRKIHVPNQISLISFDDDDLFSAVHPPITVVRQNLSAIGRKTAELLYQRITGDRDDFPKVIQIDSELIERGSVLNRTSF